MTPNEIMASATFTKPAMFAPCTVVAGLSVLGSGVDGALVDAAHDSGETLVGVLEAPGITRSILLHFESGGCNATGVGRLAGAKATFASRKRLDVHRGVVGMFAPSATA